MTDERKEEIMKIMFAASANYDVPVENWPQHEFKKLLDAAFELHYELIGTRPPAKTELSDFLKAVQEKPIKNTENI